MKKYAMLSLLLVVFLAGCTLPSLPGSGSTGTGVATGVIIKSFAPDISEVYSGDSVILSATVENVGEEDATGVVMTLFGLGTDWNGGTLPPPVDVSDLQKSQSQYDIPGGLYDTTFEVKSPDNLAVDNTYTAGLRVTYSYMTEASGLLKVYDYDYLKTIPTQAETIMKTAALSSFKSTKAPVGIQLSGVSRPLVYRTTSSNAASITVQIYNAGQGFPYTTDPGDRTITIDSVTVNGQACSNWADIAKTPTIPRTGKTSFACKFTVPSVAEFQTIPIEISLSYSYYVDGSTTIGVLRSIA